MCTMTLPETMRQISFTAPGGPEVIALQEAPLPKPGHGQVLIKVAYAGVNRPDCLQRAGAYPPPPGVTPIPGLEVAGEVVALGEGVETLHKGDALAALVSGGGYAEYCLVEAALAMPIPEGCDLLHAAALPENVLTVYDNLVTRGRMAAGESVLIHGGSSGIGSIAIQMTKAWGCRVFTTARGAEKLAFCEMLGADGAMDYSAVDFVAETLTRTGQEGVDLILDMVGGDYIPRNLRCLKLEGRLVQIAFLTGSRVEVDFRHLMMKRLTMTGSTLRPRTLAQKQAIADAVVRDIWPLVEDRRIRPQIDSIFPLADAQKAHERMESSTHKGKIMLAMG
jgi:NADPH:quinone reductase